MSDKLVTEGRLQQTTLDLLSGSDIQFRRETRLDIALVKNHEIALVFLPAADIPTFVGEGRVDLGITGRDQVAEHEALSPPTDTTGVEEVLDLGFGKCRLQVQVPEKGKMTRPEELIGKNVVTSFVGLTSSYFSRLERETCDKAIENEDVPVPNELKTKVKYVGGSVEAACALGVADGIVDLVGLLYPLVLITDIWKTDGNKESGETMKAAGLKAIDTVVESTAVLIKSKNTSNQKLVDKIASRIGGVISKFGCAHLASLAYLMNSCPKIRLLPVQCLAISVGDCHEDNTGEASSYDHCARGRRLGGRELNGGEKADSDCHG